MKRSMLLLCVLLAVLSTACNEDKQEAASVVEWGVISETPDSFGLGGPFAGVVDGALLVAGGANFPDGAPWDGGAKVWHDDVHLLRKEKGGDDKPQYVWQELKPLARPVAYGGSVSTDKGLILIGGCDAETSYADVVRLSWNEENREVESETLPSLPRPCSFMDATEIDGVIYVAGGEDSSVEPVEILKTFWSLDLNNLEAGWVELPTWDGPAKRKHIVKAQSRGKKNAVYVLGGQDLVAGDDGEMTATFQTDCHRFDIETQTWTRVADAPQPITAAPGIAVGQSHILVFGGSTGKYAGQVLKEEHPGFVKEVFVYHTITDTWLVVGEAPQGVVTSTAVAWDGGVILASGEIKPGIRTRDIMKMTYKADDSYSFGVVNFIFLGLYLGGLVAMGFYFSRREKKTDDYFLAGRRIPWWAAGLSIYATQLSAITFMSHPAVAYSMDWYLYPTKIGIFIMPLVIIYFYLPFFRRLNVTTAYEYLEQRFSVAVRLYGSLQFIVFQLARMSIVLYLPAIALSTITGIDIYTCVLVMGLLATFYTVLGGIEAVVWTDVIQTIVLLAGILFAMVLIPLTIDGGLSELVKTGWADHKFRVFYLDMNLVSATTWAILIGGFFNALVSYSSDQAVIQRYLTTKDEKTAGRGLWVNAALALPAGVMFFGVGTAFYVFYKGHPELLPLGMQNDAVFPLFISQRVPMGLAGVIIAAIFAASMSSLDSSMNSIATAVTTDFYRRFKPNASERSCLRLAKTVTAIVGIAGTVIALVLVAYDIKSLVIFFMKIVGLFGSGLAGLFFLGIFTRRANATGALIGAVVSGFVLYFVSNYTDVSLFFYSFIGFITCFIVGYVTSLAAPGRRSIEGLTFYTMPPAKTE